jgi:hypothetical protein
MTAGKHDDRARPSPLIQIDASLSSSLSRYSVERSIEETLGYYAFPEEHWRRIRTNNPLERILREIRRRTRVVGAFPDGAVGVEPGGGSAAPHRRH